jgi:hypothetical protein
MKSLLVMISLLTCFFTGGNTWAQVKPEPLPPGRPGAPVTQIKPALPTPTTPTPLRVQPIKPIQPTTPVRPPSQIRPTRPIQPPPPTPITRPPTPTPTPPPAVHPPVRPVRPEAPDRVSVPEVRGHPREQADLRGAIPAAPGFPWGWVVAGLILAGLGGYYLYRVLALPAPPAVEIKIHPNVGKQTVSCPSPSHIDLEVGLRAVADRGEQEVERAGSLIRGEETIA